MSHSKAFESSQTIVLIKEYLPTVYYPAMLFTGPHTFTGYACLGTYTQSITMSAAVTGVVITDKPTGSDLRPSVAIDSIAPAGSTFTLTFSGRYEHTPTAVDIVTSFTQTYELKTVLATEYLDQPTITHRLTAAQLTFTVPPPAVSAAPLLQSLTAADFTVAYPIKTGVTDSLGNTPPTIMPVPFSGFTASELVKGQSSLGTSALTSPQGFLSISGMGSTGNLSSGTISFSCDAWTLPKQGTTTTKTLTFVNSVVATFTASIDVKCVYEAYVAPKFASDLPNIALRAGVPYEWSLPAVKSSYPLKEIKFEPDNALLAYSLLFVSDTRVVSFDGSARVAVLSGQTFSVLITLVDDQESKTPFVQTVSIVGCPLTSPEVEALALYLGSEPLNITTTAGRQGTSQVSYKEKFDRLVEILALDDWKQSLCGRVTFVLVTSHAFLQHWPANKTISLTAERSTASAVYEDSYLYVKIDRFNFKILIRAEFVDCQVKDLLFESTSLSIAYFVGSGVLQEVLPKQVQKPDCGLVFKSILVSSTSAHLTNESVAAAVKFNSANNTLEIATNDTAFAGKSVSLTIGFDDKSVEQTNSLRVEILFKGGPSTDKGGAAGEDSRYAPIELDSVQLSVQLGDPRLVIPPLTQTQADVLKISPVRLSNEQLFAQVPLVARLANGVDYVKELVVAQRQYFARQTAGSRQPDVHIVCLDNFGALKMTFTEQLNFPSDILQIVETNLGRSLVANESNPRIEIYALRWVDLNETSGVGPLMSGWSLDTLNARDLGFRLNFTEPLQVSTGEQPDLLLVQLELSQYVDRNGKSLPNSLVKYVEIPRQVASQAQAEFIDTAGKAAVNAVSSALGSSFVVNILVAGSLYQIWSLINALQVVQLTRLFNIKSPGNVNAFSDFFTEITSIKGLEDFVSDTVDEQISLPQADPHSLNFQNAGFDSAYFVPNTRIQICLLLLQVSLSAILLLARVLECCCVRVGCLRKRVQWFIFWNGSMRLIMETFCDVMLFAMLNFYEVPMQRDDLSAVLSNNWLAVSLFTVYLVLPAVLLACSYKKLRSVEKREVAFDREFGAFLEGTRRKREYLCATLLVPISYFVKRLVLCSSLVFWQDFFWGQIALQMAVTTYMIMQLHLIRPLESPFLRRLETFNEMTTLSVLYLIMYFSDFNPDPDFKNSLGFVYIAVVAVFAAVHLFLIAVDTFKKLRLLCKRLYNRRCRSKPKVKKGPELLIEAVQTDNQSGQEKPQQEKKQHSSSESASEDSKSEEESDGSSSDSSNGQVKSPSKRSMDQENQRAPVERHTALQEEEKISDDSQWVKIPLKSKLVQSPNDSALQNLRNLSRTDDLIEDDAEIGQSQKLVSLETPHGAIDLEKQQRVEKITERVEQTMLFVQQRRTQEVIKTHVSMIGLL